MSKYTSTMSKYTCTTSNLQLLPNDILVIIWNYIDLCSLIELQKCNTKLNIHVKRYLNMYLSKYLGDYKRIMEYGVSEINTDFKINKNLPKQIQVLYELLLLCLSKESDISINLEDEIENKFRKVKSICCMNKYVGLGHFLCLFYVQTSSNPQYFIKLLGGANGFDRSHRIDKFNKMEHKDIKFISFETSMFHMLNSDDNLVQFL